MPTTTGGNIALPYPALSDTVDVPRDILALASALKNATLVGRGTIASRPAANASGAPDLWEATDQGVWYGNLSRSTWVALNGAHGGQHAWNGTDPTPEMGATFLQCTGQPLTWADGSMYVPWTTEVVDTAGQWSSADSTRIFPVRSGSCLVSIGWTSTSKYGFVELTGASNSGGPAATRKHIDTTSPAGLTQAAGVLTTVVRVTQGIPLRVRFVSYSDDSPLVIAAGSASIHVVPIRN